MDARIKSGHDGVALMSAAFQLRPYCADDEEAAIALWLRVWQHAYPEIDFVARLTWWRERWRTDLVPNTAVIVAEQAGVMTGFVTIDFKGYLDQLVVSPDHWGSELGDRLVDEAKRRSPDGISLLVNTDNAMAIRFYERNGFVQAGGDVNPISGRPVLRMTWKPL
jgi:putative acetyltransferase